MDNNRLFLYRGLAMNDDDHQGLRLTEYDVRDWFLGRACPEVTAAIDADMASGGPISKRLVRSQESHPGLAWIDNLVEADLDKMFPDNEPTKDGIVAPSEPRDALGPRRFLGPGRSDSSRDR